MSSCPYSCQHCHELDVAANVYDLVRELEAALDLFTARLDRPLVPVETTLVLREVGRMLRART